jgi:hypoxanthine-DNA glycosylase
MKKKILRSFDPFVDERSRILILGTMPGPMALLKQEYYGFSGNHFWKIIFKLFNASQPLFYPEKIALLKEKRIALWDVFKACKREGAADSAIQCAELNDILALLKKYPNIQAVFTDSKTAEKVFRKNFLPAINIPYANLPSPSPANASIPLPEKIKSWSVILNYL